MKKYKTIQKHFLVVFLILACVMSAAASGSKDINDIRNRDWILTEVKINSVTTQLVRPQALTESYTLRFEADRLSGIGAPNRYFGPYTAGPDNSLTIGAAASTMMASFIEVDGIKEGEYFAYLAKVTKWYMWDNTLLLYTSNQSGAPVILIYRLK